MWKLVLFFYNMTVTSNMNSYWQINSIARSSLFEWQPYLTSSYSRSTHLDVITRSMLMILDTRSLGVQVIVSWVFFSVNTVAHSSWRLLVVNRLDQLTSGLSLIILWSAERARLVTEEFVAGIVRKEYISLMSQVSFLRRLNDHSRCLDTIWHTFLFHAIIIILIPRRNIS